MPDLDQKLKRFSQRYADDAPASVLTPTQREYLTGQKEPSEASERAMRHRIRERLVPAMLDFELLARNLPEEELEKIRPFEGDKDLPKAGLTAWVYLMQPDYANENISEEKRVQRAATWTEHSVKNGIELALGERKDELAEVDVAIEIDRGEDLDAIAEQPLEELPRDTLDKLLTTDRITAEEYGTEIGRRLR